MDSVPPPQGSICMLCGAAMVSGVCPRCSARNTRRVRELSPPAREVSGRGSVWIPPKRRIKTPQLGSIWHLHLPRNIQDAIELTRIVADCEFRDATSDPAAITDRQERELLRGWLLRIVLSFCVAASEEIRQDRQSLAQAICQRDELFEEAARCAGFDVFRPEVRDELYRSNEWSEGERLLANAAKAGPVEHNSEIDAALPERGVKVNDEMRNKRKEKGWTQEELEAQTRGEVTVSTISRAERGARIDLKSVKKIAAALGVDSAALIDKTQQ